MLLCVVVCAYFGRLWLLIVICCCLWLFENGLLLSIVVYGCLSLRLLSCLFGVAYACLHLFVFVCGCLQWFVVVCGLMLHAVVCGCF